MANRGNNARAILLAQSKPNKKNADVRLLEPSPPSTPAARSVKSVETITNNNTGQKLTYLQMRMRDLKADIRHDVLRNRLIYTIGRGEAEKLERAIETYKKYYKDDPKALLTKAEIILQYLNLRDELFTHIENADLDKLLELCLRVETTDMRLYKELLTAELMQARKAITILKRKSMIPSSLTFDDRTMRELRRYNRPPKVMQDVVTATFLLLGECEEYTNDWNHAREMLNPFGKSTGYMAGNRRIRDRIDEFDAKKIHPEIGARARELLDQHSLSDVFEVSECCASFYVWCIEALDSVDKEIGNATPASPARQRELLGMDGPIPTTTRSPRSGGIRSVFQQTVRSRSPEPNVGGMSAGRLPLPKQPRPLPAPYLMPSGNRSTRR